MVSGASFEVVEVSGLETRYNLTREERARMIRSRKRGDKYRISIDIWELLGIVMRAFVVMVIRRECPARVEGVGADEGEIYLWRSSG